MAPAPDVLVDDTTAAPPATSRLAQAQESLRACEAQLARMRSALHALPDGVVVVDNEGRITEINPGAVHLSGWTETQSLGKPLHEVLKLCDTQGRSVDLLDSRSNGGNDVATLVRHDGHQVLVDATFASILDRRRRPIGAVVTFRNVTAARRITDELAYHATHDPLTGVLNRRAFEARLERAVQHASEHGTPHALLFLDMDRFKAVNDTGGHFAGDELLRLLSVLLKRNLREDDTLARLGGDEFAMLLEHCVPEEAAQVAERVREAVADLRFHWQGHVFEVGASIGLVTFDSGAWTPRALMLRADELCYRAKTGGRDRVCVSSAGAHGRRTARTTDRRSSPPQLTP